MSRHRPLRTAGGNFLHMVDLNAAIEIARHACVYAEGAFYGSAAELSLGVGLIYDGIRYPSFNEDTRLFTTIEGLVYVLTHECDVDPANRRLFNNYVLICPIIAFDAFAEEFVQCQSESALHGYIPDLVSDRIFRALYLPPISGTAIPYGRILYFNQICSAHKDLFTAGRAQPICALSAYAQQILDFKLYNHLLRPKAEQLPRLR